MKEKRADLHVHTTYSDSSLRPEEVVRYAKKIGLSCIAVADHDSVEALDEALGAGLNYGIEVVPAVEVSAEENGKELHMLGYYIDYKDEDFKAVLKQIREDRKNRLYKMVDALNRHGFNIDVDDLIKSVGEVSISRLHIAQYMKNKNFISSWREAFNRYIGDDKPCYVASFRHSSKQAIDLIKRARGIPVISHPGLNKVDSLLPRLVEQGIEGIEVFHSEHSSSTSKYYEKYAKEHGLLVTGGSDCHGTIKGRVLMGEVTIPYSYVEELKKSRKVVPGTTFFV